MKLILLLLILLSGIALATDVPRERIITTNINITGTSWTDNLSCNPETNETTGNTLINVTIETEDQTDNRIIKLENVNAFGPNSYSILFTKWMSCEDILENQLLNETLEMFRSCNGENCKTKYDECENTKNRTVESKQEVDEELATCRTDGEICQTNLTEAKDKLITLTNCQYNLNNVTNTLEECEKKNKDSPIYYAVAGGIGLAIGIAIQSYRKKDKTRKSIDEKRHGQPIEYGTKQPWELEEPPPE